MARMNSESPALDSGDSSRSGGPRLDSGERMRGSSPRASEGLDAKRASVDSALAQLRREIQSGRDAFEACRSFSTAIDRVVVERALAAELEPASVCLAAVGGFGRAEQCPHSDVDLLVLIRRGAATDRVERLVPLLWDAGLELGHSVRSPRECFGWMHDDLSTATALLDARHLWGSDEVYSTFREKALWRYRRRRGARFCSEQVRLLRESLEDPRRTLYVIEPDTKDGICGLRDLQRVRWIENLRHAGRGMRSLSQTGDFSVDHVTAWRAAYRFLLRVRCALHLESESRLDVLERDTQFAVARHLGYGSDADPRAAVEELMGDYYRHTRAVDCFLRYYVESETRGRRSFSWVTRTFVADRVHPVLNSYRGRLYLAGDPPNGGTPEEILDFLRVAQKKDIRPSETLREWIRQRVAREPGDLTHSAPVMRKFVSILRHEQRVGEALTAMHETGLLARILPEFRKLDCLVSFDGHHHFTVDAHTLRALRELDRIAEGDDSTEREFRRVYDELSDPLPLRLALLLHDVGKAFEGDHSVSGWTISAIVCERLGLTSEIASAVEFLVYRHLRLFRVSERRNYSDPDVIAGLATACETAERLKMLYLLTHLDIKSVGPGTWTGWKGAQLKEVYENTLERLRTGEPAGTELRSLVEDADLDDAQRARLREHCRSMEGSDYGREVRPETMLRHVELLDGVREHGSVGVSAEAFGDYHEVSICAPDRPGLFAELTGLLFCQGFSVLGARIYSHADGFAIDQFIVEVDDGVRIPVSTRIERLRGSFASLESSAIEVSSVVEEHRARLGRHRAPRPLYGPRVTINNVSSERFTVIEVNAGDRPGLLFDVASGLHERGLGVHTAKLSTFGARVRDVFYVLGADGLKVSDPEIQRRVERELLLRARGRDAAEPEESGAETTGVG